MDISVILATWNNSRRLGCTLDAMSRCRIPKGLVWQVVVVNNNSTDDTRSVARGFAERIPLVYLEEPVQGLSRARNAGLRGATGELFVFCDDDITPVHDWLTCYWNAYQKHCEKYYFGGPLDVQFEGQPLDPELFDLAPGSVTGLSFGDHPRALKASEHFLEANWACPSNVIRSLRGFDEQLGLDSSLDTVRVGEGYDLQDRLRELGFTPWYLPDSGVVHHVRSEKCELGQLAERAEAHGRYFCHVARESPSAHERPNVREFCEQRGIGKSGYLIDTNTSGPIIAGVPWRLFPKLALLWLAWRARQTLRKSTDARKSFITMRFCLGVIKGCRRQSPWRTTS